MFLSIRVCNQSNPYPNIFLPLHKADIRLHLKRVMQASSLSLSWDPLTAWERLNRVHKFVKEFRHAHVSELSTGCVSSP